MITRLLDTCTCIFLIRAKDPAIRERFACFEVGELAISSITESGLIAVTHNTLEFDRVLGLEVEDWAAE